jgi:hypothetical protein
MENEKRSFLRRADVIVIASITVLSIIFLLFTFLFRKEGDYVDVEVDGVKIGEYYLSDDGSYILNGGTNTLVIENGEAYLINSSCPDRTCEATGISGKIRYVGQTIVCLPNMLSVTVRGNSEDGVDLVS